MDQTGGTSDSATHMYAPEQDYSNPYTYEGAIAGGWRFVGGLKSAPAWARWSVRAFAAIFVGVFVLGAVALVVQLVASIF